MVVGYVEQREGGHYIAGSRVSLDSVVYAFLRGESPEGIVESFSALSLEQVFGAIAFYLANRDSIDAYLRDGRAEFARMREEARLGVSTRRCIPSWRPRATGREARVHEAAVPG